MSFSRLSKNYFSNQLTGICQKDRTVKEEEKLKIIAVIVSIKALVMHYHGIVPSSFMKKGQSLDYPSNCQLLNNGPVLWRHSSSSYMALQPISGRGLLFMRFRNLTLIDNW
jgi:hypothetical protein